MDGRDHGVMAVNAGPVAEWHIRDEDIRDLAGGMRGPTIFYLDCNFTKVSPTGCQPQR